MHDRHDRVVSLIEELAANFLRNEASSDPLITVTSVSISNDYKKATIHVTTIPDSGEDDALIFLKRKGKEMRTYIKEHANMRVIPFLEFAIDRGERHRQHIDDVALKIQQESE